ncbi:hypothetical protein QQZ08_010304 [Neonectria magnoliae]|uniref:Uncharacterized protein n=1 Tax=Neonectria magnoliae TaxID=2732573 RepID=A0ABR1HHI3_9HYPO
MGHRRSGQAENGKAPYYRDDQIHSIIGADRQDHTRMRRLLSHGFSSASMVEQQPMIRRYINLLIQRLHENSNGGRTPVDIAAWFNYTTFDIIGDLAFGESFGCLENSAMHPWIRIVFANLRTRAITKALSRLNFVDFLLPLLVSPQLIRQGAELAQLTKDKVSKRLALSEPRPDFMQSMATGKGTLSMSREEIDKNAELLTIAGSETTAATLAGAVYMLATHRAVKEKLEAEIRSSYTDEEEIDLLNAAKLPYLGAVVEETLRMYPPAPNALPRITPPQGDIILGESVPGNVVLAVSHWAMYHSESNFKHPMEFVPDRWLGDPEFSSDRRDCMNAFSFGPRNCIGKNLAYAELRMILARVMWNFDIKLADRSSDWMNQRTFLAWEKEGLYIHLTPRT